MKLNYEIKLIHLKSNLLLGYKKNLNLSPLKFDSSYYLRDETHSSPISTYYETTENIVRNYKVHNNHIFGVEFKNKDQINNSEIEINQDFVDNLFISNYKYNFELISPDFNIKTSSLNYSSVTHVIELNNNILSLVAKEDYEIDYEKNKVYIENIIEGSYYFLFSNNNTYEINKINNYFQIDTNMLLNLNNNFYSIMPAISNKKLDININKYSIEINSKKVLKVFSDVNVNFDNCSSNFFYIQPNYDLIINYNKSSLTPLINIQKFDPEYEYVIYKVIDKELLDPIWYLSNKHTFNVTQRTEFDLLMTSHEEFKRPYFVIANKSKLDFYTEEDESVFTKYIKNEDFETVKNTNKGDEDNIISLIKLNI